EEEEEDDYLTMALPTETQTLPETSLQRRQRLAKEGLRRGRVPSKAELAAQERERREEGLSRSLIAKKSKGLAMMAKMGFRPGTGLGAGGTVARVEPLRIEVREDRGGIGLEGERRRKLEEAGAAAAAAVKRPRLDDGGDYRVRMAKERDAARKEKLVLAAQKIAERMDEDEEGDEEAAGPDKEKRSDKDDDERQEGEQKKKKGSTKPSSSSKPLQSIPVLYRGLVRNREQAERDRRMRHDLETSMGTLSSKLPTYDDDTLDSDDKLALGKDITTTTTTTTTTTYMPADDLDEEDAELDGFEALDVDERLGRLVGYLRERYLYCFWCKFRYPDEGMEGCPGLEEEDHD
ncbi:hypothetical protein M406DRAFT_220993, partial [Cryphonectria parasitica EP155]